MGRDNTGEIGEGKGDFARGLLSDGSGDNARGLGLVPHEFEIKSLLLCEEITHQAKGAIIPFFDIPKSFSVSCCFDDPLLSNFSKYNFSDIKANGLDIGMPRSI